MLITEKDLKKLPRSSSEEFLYHYPVMYKEVIHILEPSSKNIFVDCTIGVASHALKILEKLPEWGDFLLSMQNKEKKHFGAFHYSIFLENKEKEKKFVVGTSALTIMTLLKLYEFNYLHLNHAKKWWTYFADLYALILLFLAISGLFVLKGKNGLAGRGKWLTAIGIILPVIFLIV